MDIEKLAQEIAEDFFRPPPDGIVYNDGPRNSLRETLADHITRHLAAWAKERDDLCRDALEEAKVHLESADDDHPQTEYALKRVEEVLRALEGETTRMDSRRQPRSLDARPCPGDPRDVEPFRFAGGG